MTIEAQTPEEYIEKLPEERKPIISKLRQILIDNLPHGFEETMNYNMITFVIPHSLYPQGYHCNPKQALPFVSLASQKNFIALYHIGIYADKQLLEWFLSEYPIHSKSKLDMGKSCIRFKKMNDIPFDLIIQLAQKMTPQAYISLYESSFKK